MCLYRYVYYSRCQHPEFIRVSYCDRAKALGHPQRDDRYRRDAGADNPPEQPPDYLSRHSSYPSPSHHSSVTHHQIMPTLVPPDAGVDVAWGDSKRILPDPNAIHMPQSALTNSNVNIGIPLDDQSSVSMELTHDGKAVELVARLELFTGHEDSDAEQVHHRDHPRPYRSSTASEYPQNRQLNPYFDGSDTDPVRASPGRIEGAQEIVSPQSDRSAHSPRKPIPSPWKTTQPRAPVFQTDRRKEERVKRKSLQGSLSPTKSLQGAGSSTYLTKDAIEPVNSDLTTAFAPSSLTKLPRRQSQASLQSPSSSPARSSPHQTASIKIQVSSARSARSTVQGQGAASNVQDQGRAHSVAPSVVSNQGTEYYSAHSPVSLVPSRSLSRRSSRDTWHTAEDFDLEPPRLSLADADNLEQVANSVLNQHDNRGRPASQHVSHSRSKTQSEATDRRLIKPAVPKLTLRNPTAKQPTNHKPPFKAGSASSSHYVSPVSPTKASSRIPRIAPLHDASTQASRLKRSQSTKSLKETKGSVVARNSQTGGKQVGTNDIANESHRESSRDPHTVPLPLTPVAVPSLRHVRTLNSAGKTPIIARETPALVREHPRVNFRLASYLDSIDPSNHPDHTPFTEEYISTDDNEGLSEPGSRKTSTSTVKPVTTVVKSFQSAEQTKPTRDITPDPSSWNRENEETREFGQIDHVDELEAQEKPGAEPNDISASIQGGGIGCTWDADSANGHWHNVAMESNPATGATNARSPEPASTVTRTSYDLKKEDRQPRGRGNQCMSQGRSQSASAHSIRSKASSELRATAPEFFPKSRDDLQASARSVTTQWMPPFAHNLAYDPFALDNYGMPWFFHMYPVHMKQSFRSPKKYKTMPRGRKRGDASLSPKKFPRAALANEPLQQGAKGVEPESTKDAVSPFASQLDEIARHAAAQQTTNLMGPLRREYMTMPPRNGRPLRNAGNGLYNTFGRKGFRPVGLPIEASAPFPDPVPPSGRKEYVGYAIERTQDGCGSVDIDRAAEWVGKACNACEPDH